MTFFYYYNIHINNIIDILKYLMKKTFKKMVEFLIKLDILYIKKKYFRRLFLQTYQNQN